MKPTSLRPTDAANLTTPPCKCPHGVHLNKSGIAEYCDLCFNLPGLQRYDQYRHDNHWYDAQADKRSTRAPNPRTNFLGVPRPAAIYPETPSRTGPVVSERLFEAETQYQRSHIDGSESASDIHVALVAATAETLHKAIWVRVAPSAVKIATVNQIPDAHYSGTICRRDSTRHSRSFRLPLPEPRSIGRRKSSVYCSEHGLQRVASASTDGENYTLECGCHCKYSWQPPPKIEPTTVESVDPLRQESERSARTAKERIRLYCPTHGMQWQVATDNERISLECGCFRTVDHLPVPAGHLSAEHIRDNEKARDLFPVVFGVQPNGDEVAQIRKDSGISRAVADGNTEIQRAGLDMTDHDADDAPMSFKRYQLIEGCDDIEVAPPYCAKEDHHEPLQFTLEDIVQLARDKGIKLRLDEKKLLLWKAQRLPGNRVAHKLSRRQIALTTGKSEDWVRYHFDVVKRKFLQAHQQQDKRLIASYSEKYSKGHPQNMQSGQLGEGGAMTQDSGWEVELVDLAIRRGITPEQFAEILTMARQEILHAVLAAMLTPGVKHSYVGLSADQLEMIGQAAEAAWANTELSLFKGGPASRKTISGEINVG